MFWGRKKQGGQRDNAERKIKSKEEVVRDGFSLGYVPTVVRSAPLEGFECLGPEGCSVGTRDQDGEVSLPSLSKPLLGEEATERWSKQ